MRRLPVYILLQTSGAMKGEPIEAMKVGLETMLSSLRRDPFALESVHISIITFSRRPETLVELTDLENLQIPDIPQPSSGGTHLGESMLYLFNKVSKEIRVGTSENRGDWMPLLFIMSDGRASDPIEFKKAAERIKSYNFGSVVGCIVGDKINVENIEKIVDHSFHIETTCGTSFSQFFKWVSESVSIGSKSLGVDNDILLPPPPKELNKLH